MKYTKEKLEPVVAESRAISEILRKLDLKQSGGNHTHISKKIKSFGLDTSHFIGRSWNRGKQAKNKYSEEDFIKHVLVLDGPAWNSHNIKLKLFEFGLKEKKCENCPQGEIWNGKELRFHLDHDNGNHSDNRLKNLKILCPNCHSQTPTYAAKKRK